ncbi:kinase-like domain-containing protein [Mycena latifolia]|nr:kinase-like domain-containing protein [Mycena latifolia]
MSSIAAETGMTSAASNDMSSQSVRQQQGWVPSVLSPFIGFIDAPINPRNHYLDLKEIASDRPGGTTLYVARLADAWRDQLMLPSHVKERDQHDFHAKRPTFVAIKSVPIMPTGSPKLVEVLRELRLMHDIRCENILGMDALYVDPIENALWIRMEFMTRTLSSVTELHAAGLELSDRVIAGCAKDILIALEHLRINGIAPRNICAYNVLINTQGVLKLTNLSNAMKLPPNACDPNVVKHATVHIASNAKSLGALVWEMAAGKSPPVDTRKRPEDWPPLSSIVLRVPAFHEFLQKCFEPGVGRFGYHGLIESAFISDACERTTLLQLFLQCSAFEGRLREHRRGR